MSVPSGQGEVGLLHTQCQIALWEGPARRAKQVASAGGGGSSTEVTLEGTRDAPVTPGACAASRCADGPGECELVSRRALCPGG